MTFDSTPPRMSASIPAQLAAVQYALETNAQEIPHLLGYLTELAAQQGYGRDTKGAATALIHFCNYQNGDRHHTYKPSLQASAMAAYAKSRGRTSSRRRFLQNLAGGVGVGLFGAAWATGVRATDTENEAKNMDTLAERHAGTNVAADLKQKADQLRQQAVNQEIASFVMTAISAIGGGIGFHGIMNDQSEEDIARYAPQITDALKNADRIIEEATELDTSRDDRKSSPAR